MALRDGVTALDLVTEAVAALDLVTEADTDAACVCATEAELAGVDADVRLADVEI